MPKRRTIFFIILNECLTYFLLSQVVYTAGRPPWYDCHGTQLREPFIIGICGGSASGKTTVTKNIIELLDIPWVTLLSMDSFYKVLDEEQHKAAAANEYNFDHPSAFDFGLILKTLQRLKEGKRVEVTTLKYIQRVNDAKSSLREQKINQKHMQS